MKWCVIIKCIICGGLFSHKPLICYYVAKSEMHVERQERIVDSTIWIGTHTSCRRKKCDIYQVPTRNEH